MTDINASNLASQYVVVSVTIPSAATHMVSLLASSVSAKGGTARILQVNVLAVVTAGTDRDAILFGDSTAQLGYLAAGEERAFPIRGADFYVKRAGGSDVTAIVEVYMMPRN